MEEQPQSAKRKRRPSVRLGEIGYSGPYDASSMWTEVPRQRKKPQPGVKPPRIRPLEHLAAETAVIEEEWGVIEPIQPEQQQNDDDSAPVIKEIKRRKPRTTTKQQPQEVAPPSPEDDDEKDYEEEAPLEEAPSSSDSEEDLPASDDSEQANPNSHEMQGAIEDGPNRRSRAPRVSNKASIRDREDDLELAIKDPVPLAVPNGTPNSSSQRDMLSAGVSGWLQDLGLGKYAELFELNEVDTEVLPLLTFDDLREMGVEAVGARRKMFHGIQELGQIRGI